MWGFLYESERSESLHQSGKESKNASGKVGGMVRVQRGNKQEKREFCIDCNVQAEYRIKKEMRHRVCRR